MILSSIYNLIIGPIVLILESVYGFLVLVVRNNHGFAVLGISVIVSLLCLPLYLKAEKLQEKERLIQQKMAKKIAQIKQYFKKDEQYMLISMYYRINHYHPIMSLRSSFGLLIQVPFFIAAYHFLSGFEPLQGEPFLWIRNLGAPDALISFGSITINILPVLMTLINIVSGFIYTRGFPIKEKLQLYGMSIFFLVLLYNSPAALVLYWTCNNIISLVKNIILKSKHSGLIFYILLSVLLISSCLYVIFFRFTGRSNQISFRLAAIGFSVFILSIPILLKLIIPGLKKHFFFLKKESGQIKTIFILSCLSFGVLCAIFIPFNIVASDPAEFSYIVNASPFNVLVPPLFVSLGLFCFWPICIYFLGNDKIRIGISFFMSFALVFGLINTFLFSGNYGMLSQTLAFPGSTNFMVSNTFSSYNIAAGICIFLLILSVFRFNKLKILSAISSIIMVSMIFFSAIKTAEIQRGYLSHKSIVESNIDSLSIDNQNKSFSVNEDKLDKQIFLSKDGHNVFIVMLDKALGVFFKSIINEHERLKTSFNGFVYYPNTVSFYRSTILGAPPLFGGYEYTPERLHQRNNELMKDKYTESSLVLPELFKNHDYSANVYDLPYVNHQRNMELSFFTERGINANNLEGKYNKKFIDFLGSDAPLKETQTELILKHNFTMFSVFLTSPVILRKIIYDRGNYWAVTDNSRLDIVTNSALTSYAVLHYLPELTCIENTQNTFTLMVANMAHDPSFLQYPDYTVVSEVTDFGPDLFNGNINSHQFYHVNAASYLLLEKWFDFLKENNVYNNTRIIIVSDHAGVLFNDPSGLIGRDYTAYNPILLFKDFNSTGELRTDNSFMTNADTPLLAIMDIIPNAKNPFSGQSFFSEKEDGVNIFLGGSSQTQDFTGWEALDKVSYFYHVKDNIFDKNNWTKITKRY
ncbi:MAG: membrane protein insertase YidC [Treponema sp.]|jgi:YidC/Oxa1 family membrane protein insertase|nr:membrane protein insertase YidC [Treponema sp.]